MGLDMNGRPISSGGAEEQPLTPTLQSIQDNVFTPICAQCHIGAAAPLGLRLDEGSSFAMLVNAPSVEVPSLLRVSPGHPDDSYIIQKLEGHQSVGGQMPLGQPPLPQAQIDVIRQWITDGAMATASLLPGMSPMSLHAVVPEPGEALERAPNEILITADGELDVSTLNSASISLERSGGDGTFGDGNEVRMPNVRIVIRSLEPTVLAITMPRDAWVSDTYALRIRGKGAAVAAMTRAGAPVADFRTQFTIGANQ